MQPFFFFTFLTKLIKSNVWDGRAPEVNVTAFASSHGVDSTPSKCQHISAACIFPRLMKSFDF